MIRRKESGFSLLEIVIVMAIAGGLLTMYTRYVRKQADRSSQRNISAALVQEMKGVINFVRDPDIVVMDEESSKTEEISNPLYNTETPDADYQVRLSNDVNDVDTGGESEYYLWGDGGDASQQQRYRFTSSSCKATLKSTYAFEKEYLSCWMSGAAKNTSAHIDRVGFRGSDLENQQSSINQIDVIVEFGADSRHSLLDFTRFQPALAQALADAGNLPSHAWVVHRESSGANWQLVTKNSDGKNPVEFGSVASSIDTLNGYTTGEFGVRFTFDLNDNDSGTVAKGGGADMCWNSEDSQVEMCYEQRSGTGTHGENTVLALNMKDANNTNGYQKFGTLQANLVMENTARRVYIFQRSIGGDLIMRKDGSPAFFQYTDPTNQSFIGEYYMNDRLANDPSGFESSKNYFSKNYDAFELVTPPIVDYVAHNLQDHYGPAIVPSDHMPVYDDSLYTNKNNEYNSVRYPVQTCPQIEQDIFIRDRDGKIQNDDNGKPKTVNVIRKLFPRLSVAISSVAAYPDAVEPVYDDPSQNRNYKSGSGVVDATVGLLGGITIQTEFKEQDTTEEYGGKNAGDHFLYDHSKYIWIISSDLGMYSQTSGAGVNKVNSDAISYNVSRWCSTIPQEGTPADLLDSYQYQ